MIGTYLRGTGAPRDGARSSRAAGCRGWRPCARAAPRVSQYAKGMTASSSKANSPKYWVPCAMASRQPPSNRLARKCARPKSLIEYAASASTSPRRTRPSSAGARAGRPQRAPRVRRQARNSRQTIPGDRLSWRASRRGPRQQPETLDRRSARGEEDPMSYAAPNQQWHGSHRREGSENRSSAATFTGTAPRRTCCAAEWLGLHTDPAQACARAACAFHPGRLPPGRFAQRPPMARGALPAGRRARRMAASPAQEAAQWTRAGPGWC